MSTLRPDITDVPALIAAWRDAVEAGTVDGDGPDARYVAALAAAYTGLGVAVDTPSASSVQYALDAAHEHVEDPEWELQQDSLAGEPSSLALWCLVMAVRGLRQVHAAISVDEGWNATARLLAREARTACDDAVAEEAMP